MSRSNRFLALQAVLATGGLVVAWMVYDGGEQQVRAATAVTVFDCDGRKLQSVELVTANKRINVQMNHEAGDNAAWVTVTETAPLPAGATPTEPNVKRFAASERIGRLVDKVAPLRVERSVGEVTSAKLAELGLAKAANTAAAGKAENAEQPDKPENGEKTAKTQVQDTLTVKCADETRTYKLGDKTYGGRTRYMVAPDGGAVHLLGSGMIGDLEMAEFRYMQRDLTSFRLDSVTELTVKAAGAERKLLHRNRKEPSKAMWVAADAPTQRNELFDNWLNKITRLRAVDYLKQGAEPGQEAGKSTIPVDVVTLVMKGDREARIEIIKIPAAPSAGDGGPAIHGKPKKGAATYYARSTATRGWVTVPASLAQQIDDDVGQVVGTEKAPAAGDSSPDDAHAHPAAATLTGHPH